MITHQVHVGNGKEFRLNCTEQTVKLCVLENQSGTQCTKNMKCKKFRFVYSKQWNITKCFSVGLASENTLNFNRNK